MFLQLGKRFECWQHISLGWQEIVKKIKPCKEDKLINITYLLQIKHIYLIFSEGLQEDSTTSLLAIAWEVWTINQAARFQRLTLFDLNQWYREYMPHSSDISYSHFMTHFCLPDGLLLAAKVLPHTVKQFVTLQPVDEHFYPSGTTFRKCQLVQFCKNRS